MTNTITMINFTIQTALLLGVFHAIKPIRQPDIKRRIGAILAITALLLLYYLKYFFTTTVTVETTLRFLYRIICCALYLKWQKGINWKKALYFSGLISTVYHLHLNIFISPMVFPSYYLYLDFLPYMNLPTTFSLAIVHISSFLLYTLIYKAIPFNEIDHIGYGRFGILLTAMFCTSYVKYTLQLMFRRGFLNFETFTSSILLEVLLIFMLIGLERYLHEQRNKKVLKLQHITSKYNLQNIKNSNSNKDELLHLSHDIKNHLLAIRQLLSSNTSQTEEYINMLIGKFDNQLDYVYTGNDLLNGLISEKITEASSDNIEFSIILDARNISFVSDIDICTIFGNALDNAIEASRKVTNIANRYISIRSTYAANQILIFITNACEEKVNLINGIPQTSKPSHMLHGIGIHSILHTLQKYKGTMSIDTKTNQKFILKIMIPLPTEILVMANKS